MNQGSLLFGGVNGHAATARVTVASGFPHWENTQAWSIGCPIKIVQTGSLIGSVILTSADAAPYPFPMELYVTNTGLLRIRIVSNFAGNDYLGMTGTTNLYDGNRHYVWGTYDGSKTAAGCKLYVDGVLESMTVERDTLSGSSVNANNLIIGSQLEGGLYYHPFQYLGPIRVSNIVRDATYVGNNSSFSTPPAVDGNTVLAYDFDEQTGTTCNDLSSGGYDGTLSSSSLWSPWNQQPPAVDPMVQTNTAGYGNSASARTVVMNSNVVAGNSIVVGVATFNSGITVTVTDSQGNTYTKDRDYVVNGNNRVSIWRCSAAVGGACTVTVTPSATAFVSINATEYPPMVVSPVDNTVSATGTSNTPSAGTPTVSGSRRIIYAVAGQADINTGLISGNYFRELGSVKGSGFENALFQDCGFTSTGREAKFFFNATSSLAWAAGAVSYEIAANPGARRRRALICGVG